MKIKSYPWLQATYRRIVKSHQQKRGHHALLIHSQNGNGELLLFYALAKWFLCSQREGIKNCRSCHSCKLIKSGNHSDYYQLEPNKGKLSIGVTCIRKVITDLYEHARHGGNKVVLITRSELLTEQAINTLLKILEEPPSNTYFLLGCQEPAYLLPTIVSRCVCWPLHPPNEDMGIRWLQNKGVDDDITALSALRLSSGAPLAALSLLSSVRWQKRLSLCEKLSQIIVCNNFLSLLSHLNQDIDEGAPIYWLLSLLSDSIKWHYGLQSYLVNVDQYQLIIELSSHWSVNILHNQFYQWFRLRAKCHKIRGLNRELLLTCQLLNCEQNTFDKSFYPWTI